MSRILAIIAPVLVVLGCGEPSGEPQLPSDLTAFAREVVTVFERVELGHRSLLDSAVEALPVEKRVAQYAADEGDVRLALRQFGGVATPAEGQKTRDLVESMLTQEREAWVHMVLFARTRQELHRVIATELLVDAAEIRSQAVDELEAALVAAGLEVGDLELRRFAIATAAHVPVTVTPVTLALVVTSTPVSPTPTATATRSPVRTASPTITATPTFHPRRLEHLRPVRSRPRLRL